MINKKKVFIILPVKDESESIEKCIKRLNLLKKKLTGYKIKIIVINDGSVDGSEKKIPNTKDILLVNYPNNRGLGYAVRSGIIIAKKFNADFVVKVDADLQHEYFDIIKLLDCIELNKFDLVYGRRVLVDYKMSIIRKLGNLFFTYLMKKLTGWNIQDSQPGMFITNKKCLNCLKIYGNYNYTQQILLSARINHMTFGSVDIKFKKRQKGVSFVSLKYIYKALGQILILLLAYKPLRVFGTLASFLLLTAFAIIFVQSIDWVLGNSSKVVQNVNLVLGLITVGGYSLIAGLLGELFININSNNDNTQEYEIDELIKKNEKK